MAKKKKSILDIDLSGLESINTTLSSLTEKISKEIAPLNFNNLESQINNLKKSVDNATKAKEDNTKNEGETCIHGNSWNSECSDCNELSLIDDIFGLVVEYPNDSELGAKIRELYNTYTKISDNTEE